MTDKERLEEMEELLNEYYENIDDTFASTDNAMAIIDRVGYFVKRVQELEEQLQGLHKMYDIRLAKSDELSKQNKRYREALEFYADKEKYFIRMDELELPEDILHAEPRIVYDRGRTALKALEETK